jgi:phosphoribosylformylglycinamidine synthase
VLLFAESNSRFLAEVRPENVKAFEARLAGLPAACIGRSNDSVALTIHGLDGRALVETVLADLKAAWQTPLMRH